MLFDFLKYNSANINLTLIEMVYLQVTWVYISNDLVWNKHCYCIYGKAIKRLFGIRVLKKWGLPMLDLVSVSLLEYAALPIYLSNLIVLMQIKTLGIIFP